MKHAGENIDDIIKYFSISLFGEHTVEEILWDLAKNCIARLGLEDCVIYLLDEERNVLVQKAAYGPKSPGDRTIHQPIEIPVGKGIVGSVARHGVPEIIADTSKDPRYIRDDKFRYSEITVPIVQDDRVIGVIDSEHSQPGFFTDRHLRIFSLIAALCAHKLMWTWAEEKIRNDQQNISQALQSPAELKLQALRSQMNPHFISNALRAIQSFITERETGEALNFLSLFGKFVREILRVSAGSFITLGEEVAILTRYLELEKLQFGKKFDYVIGIDPAIDPARLEIPVLFMHPFAERALTDGLLNRGKTGTVNIHFTTEGHMLRCRIRTRDADSLDGFIKPVYRHAAIKAEPWWEVHERIELLNRLHDADIQVNLVGTLIEINMPCRRAPVQ